jgi:hypothetical protein
MVVVVATAHHSLVDIAAGVCVAALSVVAVGALTGSNVPSRPPAPMTDAVSG